MDLTDDYRMDNVSDKVFNVASSLRPGQFFTIDWVRIEDGTRVSINAKLHRKDADAPYVWFTKAGEARCTLTGSPVKSRTAPRNDGRMERNQSTNDAGMAYWTVPLSNVTMLVVNGEIHYFDPSRRF